jgi:hypothetical protein
MTRGQKTTLELRTLWTEESDSKKRSMLDFDGWPSIRRLALVSDQSLSERHRCLQDGIEDNPKTVDVPLLHVFCTHPI